MFLQKKCIGCQKNFLKFVFSILFILLINPLFGAVIINVKDFGAKGNGINDDFSSIQKAIDYVSSKGGGTIYFSSGTFVVKNQSLVIWGSNIELIGGDNTILKKVGASGWWGELLEVAGKINGYRYYGGFGSTKYNNFIVYRGKSIPSNNIKIKNLTFDSSMATNASSNNVGVINSTNIYFNNCSFLNAPQTNLGIINDMRYFSNLNIELNNCNFSGAKDHNVRVISYEKGNHSRNSVKISNSIFSRVKGKSKLKELKSNNLHLWYRAGANPNSSLIINNCSFDSTGDIIATVNGKGLNITNSKISGKLIYEDGILSDLTISNNNFSKSPQSSLKINSRSSITKFSRDNKFQ